MKTVFLLLVFSVWIPMAYGEIIVEQRGIINDLMISENSEIFYFELDETIKSPTWIPDTYIMMNNGIQTSKVSDTLFIYPTELNEFRDYLYFAVLSEKCLESNICDYQDIIKMSKDGSYETIYTNLNSAIHIFIENHDMFVSESNGNIWNLSVDGRNKELLHHTNNIVMDIAVNAHTVFWIEEIDDLNSRVMSISGQNEPQIIDDNLRIPYDLRVDNNIVHWNDIFMQGKDGKLGEFTAIHTFEDNSVKKIFEFENKSPLSRDTSYGPYRTFGDHIFVVNNTGNNSVIHQLGIKDNSKLEVGTVTDYDIKFLRNDYTDLYTIGVNDDGFVIEHFSVSLPIPESDLQILYGIVIAVVIIVMFILIVFFKKICRDPLHPRI